MVDGVIASHQLLEEASRMMRKLLVDLLATARNSNNTTFQRRRSCGVKLAHLTRKFRQFSRTIYKEQLKNSLSRKDSWHSKLVIWLIFLFSWIRINFSPSILSHRLTEPNHQMRNTVGDQTMDTFITRLTLSCLLIRVSSNFYATFWTSSHLLAIKLSTKLDKNSRMLKTEKSMLSPGVFSKDKRSSSQQLWMPRLSWFGRTRLWIFSATLGEWFTNLKRMRRAKKF